jgi:signal transduction histidine kinase
VAAQGAQGEELERKKQAPTGLSVAAAAHELKSPVEAITNLIYLLQRNLSLDEEARSYVQQIENELAHMRHVIRQTLLQYREPASPTLVPLSDVLDTILRFFDHKIAFKQIHVERRYECDGLVRAHPEDLRQVFSNLVVNALEALRLHGKLTVHIYQSRRWCDESYNGVRVTVADNGGGILREHRDKILSQKLFTTKGGKGTGLGLKVSAEIVRKAGGSIRFRSSAEPGRSGTVFSVFLPTMPASERRSAA